MTRARELARLANENVFTAEDYNSPVQVGINSTDPTSTLDVRGELKVGTAIQAGTAGVVTATEFSGSIGTFSGAGSFGGNLDVTGNVTIGGTLTYEDVTNIDVIGIVTAQNGVNISGGQLLVGSGVTIGNAGVATFSGTSDIHLLDNVRLNVGDGSDLTLSHDGSNSYIKDTGTGFIAVQGSEVFLRSSSDEKFIHGVENDRVDIYFNNSKKWETTNDGTVTTGIATATGGLEINADNKYLKIGASNDLQLYHSGTHSFIKNTQTGYLILSSDSLQLGSNTGGEAYFNGALNGAATLYYDNSSKLDTTYEGAKITGFTSTTAGMGVTGGLYEGAFIKAGKLSDNKTLGISTANVFYFTTQESTTATPNIVWNDSYSLSSKMAVGDVASVTVITTAAAGGYSANWTIDGNAVTEEWIGGDAPSEGGSDGLDIYSLTIIKTGTGTGDSGFKIIGNLSNAT